MRCRYMHDYTSMRCVDENYDSSEDSDEYDTLDSTTTDEPFPDSTTEANWEATFTESHSQVSEITVKKLHKKDPL